MARGYRTQRPASARRGVRVVERAYVLSGRVLVELPVPIAEAIRGVSAEIERLSGRAGLVILKAAMYSDVRELGPRATTTRSPGRRGGPTDWSCSPAPRRRGLARHSASWPAGSPGPPAPCRPEKRLRRADVPAGGTPVRSGPPVGSLVASPPAGAGGTVPGGASCPSVSSSAPRGRLGTWLHPESTLPSFTWLSKKSGSTSTRRRGQSLAPGCSGSWAMVALRRSQSATLTPIPRAVRGTANHSRAASKRAWAAWLRAAKIRNIT